MMFTPRSFVRLLATAGLVVSASAFAATLGSAELKSEKTRIGAEYKAARAACNQQAGNAKDICVLQAKGSEKVALADLQYRKSGEASDGTKLALAKADAAYAVAKERCDDKAGNDKDVCRKEANAVYVKARADTKLATDVTAARVEANDDKRNAEFKLAIEKCNAFASEAKTSCVTAAKASFGKS